MIIVYPNEKFTDSNLLLLPGLEPKRHISFASPDQIKRESGNSDKPQRSAKLCPNLTFIWAHASQSPEVIRLSVCLACTSWSCTHIPKDLGMGWMVTNTITAFIRISCIANMLPKTLLRMEKCISTKHTQSLLHFKIRFSHTPQLRPWANISAVGTCDHGSLAGHHPTRHTLPPETEIILLRDFDLLH